MCRLADLLALLLIVSASTFAAQSEASAVDGTAAPTAFGLDQAAALRTSQQAIGRQPADYTLRDRANQPVALSQFRGTPLLVNFVYTGCFQVCPTSTRALHRAVDAMRDRFGVDQFKVITIGFNQPTDSPMAMNAFALQQQISDENWKFLSPAAADVDALAQDFGFSYVATPIGFEHTLQVSILDADGLIRNQVYGDAFTADSLGEPLRELLTGSLLRTSVLARSSISDILDKVRILCSVYDPSTGKYRVDYSLYIEIAGFLTFVLTLLVLSVQELRARRARHRKPAS